MLFGQRVFEGLRDNTIFLTSSSSVGLREKELIFIWGGEWGEGGGRENHEIFF